MPDYKIIFTIIATIVGTGAFLPYILDTLSLKTKPHTYTWFIWSLTQGMAVFGIWYGGGGWGGLNLVIGTSLVFLVFLFSLKYGTKNITKSDGIVFIAAICAILVWWKLNQPVLAIIMVSAIDLIGYIPSFRKSYEEPWSETVSSWFAFALSDVLALMALSEYNLMTTTYLITIVFANFSLFLLCVYRRRYIPKPVVI